MAILLGEQLVDLRSCPVNENNLYSKAVEQGYITNNVTKVPVGNGFASQHNDHGFATVSIYVRG
jgi:hypothetical protein